MGAGNQRSDAVCASRSWHRPGYCGVCRVERWFHYCPCQPRQESIAGAPQGATQPVAQEARQPQPAQSNPPRGASAPAGSERAQGFSPQDKYHGAVVVEALPVRNMSASAKRPAQARGRNARAKTGLNGAILDQGGRAFRIMLASKLAARGARLPEVAAAYTSQTCAACGVVDARSRRDQSHFICVACGHEANADTNAA